VRNAGINYEKKLIENSIAKTTFMKAILIFLILISSFTSFSQSDNVMAITLKLETIDNNLLDYKLTFSR
jgi:outer membrane lipoprotein-sorting protein